MDDDRETRRILQKNLKLAEENNRILRRLQRAMRWGRLLKIMYWLFIIGTAVGAYYFLQPLFGSLQETFRSFTTGVDTLKSVGQQIPDIGSLFKNLGR